MNEKRIRGAFGTNLGKESETSESKESLAQLDKGIKFLAAMAATAGATPLAMGAWTTRWSAGP